MVVRAPATTRSPEQADERLLIEAAQKDPARFADLYEINFERVYAFVARRVGDRDAAEDLTSEVFHKALANLPRLGRCKGLLVELDGLRHIFESQSRGRSRMNGCNGFGNGCHSFSSFQFSFQS